MKTITLIKRNLTYYWRTNGAVVLGVAVAVAVLVGALMVGDSVRASLRELFLQRIGRTHQVISSTGFFRERLVDELQRHEGFAASGYSAACPLIVLNGMVIHEESGRRGAGVQVYGVDERFWKFHGVEVNAPNEREILVSPNLAQELGSKTGDSLRVRIEKPSEIPVESLHGRKEDVGRTIRFTIREVLPVSKLGEFSLRLQQGPVRAVFVPLQRLQEDTEQAGKVNTILLSSKTTSDKEEDSSRISSTERLLKDTTALEDIGVKIRVLEDQNCLVLESDSALLTDELAGVSRATADNLNLHTMAVFSYLANTIRFNEREIPYSLVTAIDQESFESIRSGGFTTYRHSNDKAERPSEQSKENEQGNASILTPILLNDWAANDLRVKAGDVVSLDYYLWREEGRLTTETAQFQVAGVIPIKGLAADRNLTPEYPGISGTESLSDWDPPFPINLERVRPHDEDYWRQYRTTPKAFIPLARGQQLWQTRFGKLTSLRFYPSTDTPLEAARETLEKNLRSALNPLRTGLSVYAVRDEGLKASRGATDFGEYFLYFSFFLVVSALLLASLFFKLGVEQRAREIGLLQAVGFPAAKIRTLFLSEGVMLAAFGSLVGVGGAILYGSLMMWGLRTWWVDAVGTRLLTLHVSPTSLIWGGVGGIFAALACIWWTLRTLAKVTTRSLLAGNFEGRKGEWGKDRMGEGERGRSGEAGSSESSSSSPFLPFSHSPIPSSPIPPFSHSRLFAPIAIAVVCSVLGFLLLILAALKIIGETAGFFGAGMLLLVALLCFQSVWLRGGRRRLIQGRGWWPVARLGFRNATHRPGRSVLCIALVASATFIIVAVDAFRQDSRESSLDKKSGSGGFTLFAESLLPLTHDPNSAEGREAINLNTPDETSSVADVTFTRFRMRPGDDASCLNLYQPRNPKILAATSDFIHQNRFAFQDSLATTKDEKENPWLLLDKESNDGTVPVIADAKSMTYVLHRRLGDEIVVEGNGGKPVRLRLVAALSDSLFQSELLMSERNFLRLFPEQQGYRFFLLDVTPERTATVAARLEEQLSDFGFDVLSTAERLASYHRVENTYLSTFQTLGGLGMLLGTLGLATVLLRNVLERRRELALLRAVGYNSQHFAVMVIAENALLLLCGLMTGILCALLAIAPALSARAAGGYLPNFSLGLLLLAVLITGFAASLLATVAALRSPLLPALRAE